MGFYLQTQGRNIGKANALIAKFGGQYLGASPRLLTDIPSNKALVCVVHNRAFEAAAVVYEQAELDYFVRPDSGPEPSRYREWIVLNDKDKVYEAAGIKQEYLKQA